MSLIAFFTRQKKNSFSLIKLFSLSLSICCKLKKQSQEIACIPQRMDFVYAEKPSGQIFKIVQRLQVYTSQWLSNTKKTFRESTNFHGNIALCCTMVSFFFVIEIFPMCYWSRVFLLLSYFLLEINSWNCHNLETKKNRERERESQIIYRFDRVVFKKLDYFIAVLSKIYKRKKKCETVRIARNSIFTTFFETKQIIRMIFHKLKHKISKSNCPCVMKSINFFCRWWIAKQWK